MPEKPPEACDYLSTGSTLLNLACSGRSLGGFLKGTYNFLVGDSSSGKTFLSLTCMAEASVNPVFDEYQFVHADAEHGALMDFKRFFGEKMSTRVIPTGITTVEEFYYDLDNRLAEGPCVYVLDSMDSIITEDDQDKFEERKKAHTNGKKVSGSYGMAKPKMNSDRLRAVIPKLQATGSILIIISQTRDTIGYGAQFNPKTRSGGNALKFYAHLELWSSRKRTITVGSKESKKQIGIESLVKVKKNRLSGMERQVTIPIYFSAGIDDIGSCVNYLIQEGHWNGKSAPEFDYTGNAEGLCQHIDQLGKSAKHRLRKITASKWREIEAKCKVKRTNPYQE